MALTQEQQAGLLKAYQQGIASGLTKEQSTAAVKDYLIKSGQYESAKAAYQSPESAQQVPKLSPIDEYGVKTGSQNQIPESAPAYAPVAPKASATAPAPVAPAEATVSAPAPKPTAVAAPKATPAPAPSAPVVSPERSQQINANLTEGAKNAKQNFADVNTFKAAYGYDQKPEGEKAILDSFWSKYAEQNAIKPVASPTTPTPVAPTKDALVTAIWNNQETAEMKADPQYQGLKNAADKARKFSSMSADELVGAITSSQITDAQAAVISKLDPSFGMKWEAAKAQYKLKIDSAITNQSAANLANRALGAETDTTGTTQKSYEDPVIAAINKQIEAITASSAISQAEKDARSEVNAKKAKIDELTEQRDKVYEDIVKTHPGLPKSLTMAMAAEKSKPLNEQISSLTREANLALGVYNAAVEERQTSGETAKTVASLNLEVAKRYADVQEARAKALQEKLKAQKLETKVETLNVNGSPTKFLIDMQTGKPIANLGPDVSSTKYQLTDYMGMKMAYDPTNGTMKPVATDIQGNPEQEQKLNKEYASDAVVKGFDITKQAYSRVMQVVSDSLAGRGNGIKDISVMYDYVKGLDPTSVVRESEIGLMNQANAMWGKITTGLANLSEGRVLNETILKQVGEQMQNFYDIAKTEVAKKQAGYIRRASDVKARVDRVIDGDIYAQYNADAIDAFLGKQDAVSLAEQFLN